MLRSRVGRSSPSAVELVSKAALNAEGDGIMLGTLIGLGMGAAIFAGAWSASSFGEGHVSTGAMTLGILGAISVTVLVSVLARLEHQGPE